MDQNQNKEDQDKQTHTHKRRVEIGVKNNFDLPDLQKVYSKIVQVGVKPSPSLGAKAQSVTQLNRSGVSKTLGCGGHMMKRVDGAPP